MAEQSNPGQTALIVGIAAALIGAGLGAYTMTGGKPITPDTSIAREEVSVEDLTQQVRALNATMAVERKFQDVAPKGVMIGDKPRHVSFLFAPELWQVRFDKLAQNKMIDIYDASSPNIHQDIPNLWFIENGLLEDLGLSTGATNDTDGDGFSNLEEYKAKTDPSAADAYPALAASGQAPKLLVKSIVTTKAIISADSMLAYETAEPAEVAIKIFADASDVSPTLKYTLKKGDSFGVSDKDPKRFTIVGFEKGDYVDASGASNAEMAVIIKDSFAPEASQDSLVRAGKPRANDKDKGTPNEKGRTIEDTIVTFEVTAGSAAGKDAAIFKVPLINTFTLPGGDKSTFIIESIDENGSVNIRPNTEGSTSINIPKAI